MSRPADPGRGDRGSATVLALVGILVVSGAGVLGATWSAAVEVRHRAAAAADLAALAAAVHPFDPPAAVCAVARATATGNGGRLETCRLEGGGVTVGVAVTPPPWLRWLGPARGRARAVPVPDISDEKRPVRAPS